MRKNWKTVKLSEVTEFIRNGIVYKPAKENDSGIPITRIETISNGIINFEKIGLADKSTKNIQNYKLQFGDILFSHINSLDHMGKTAFFSEGDLYHGMNLFCIRADTKLIDPQFLFQFLNTKASRNYFMKSSRPAVAQLSLTVGDVSELKVFLPPLDEQKKIAAILRTWDDAIEKQDKIVASLQKKRKALLGKLLLKQQTNKPLKYFAKPVAREVDKPTSAYHALGLRSHCKGTFQRFIKDAATVAMETLYQVKENDLIVNITFAWEGAIALVKKNDEHCLVSHRFPTYEIDTSKALPQFIRHVVQTKKFIESLGIISPGGAGRNRVLSKKDFLELKIWLPDLSTQAHIADIISTLELEIETATSLLERFKTQKRGLMQKLLTGAWPVQADSSEESSNKKEKKHA